MDQRVYMGTKIKGQVKIDLEKVAEKKGLTLGGLVECLAIEFLQREDKEIYIKI